MRTVIFFNIICFIFLSVKLASAECSVDAIIKKEREQIINYSEGITDSVSVIVFDEKFLPLPTRFSFLFSPSSKRMRFSSVVHPFSYFYMGCNQNFIPRGIVALGSKDDCLFCKKPEIPLGAKRLKLQVGGNYQIDGFVMDNLWFIWIYSKSSFIEISDYNTSIAEVWWGILTKEKLVLTEG